MNIANQTIDRFGSPYIIAEIGVNHDGCVKRAKSLIEQAADCGADAVKFQIFEADALLSSRASLTQGQAKSGECDPLAMLKRLTLSWSELDTLIVSAHDCSLHAIASVFSTQLVDHAAQQGWDAFKIASPDLINDPLVKALVSTGRPLFVSTGASTMQEVNQATSHLGSHPYLLMHCVSAYPTPDDYANLGGIMAMATQDDRPVGYSDHTTSVDTGALAIVAGATVLEKHLTYDQLAHGPDHAMSLNPDTFKQYVSAAHRAHRMVGVHKKEPMSVELEVRSLARQSLTTTRFLAQGTVLKASDLTLKRPGSGLPPSALEQTIGRRLTVDLAADVPVKQGDLA